MYKLYIQKQGLVNPLKGILIPLLELSYDCIGCVRKFLCTKKGKFRLNSRNSTEREVGYPALLVIQDDVKHRIWR